MAARIVPKGVISAYGEIYAHDYGTAISVSSSGFTKIDSFSVNGESLNMTPDHPNNCIRVDVAGTYMVMISIVAENGTVGAQVVEFSMFKINGGVEFLNIHSHRSLAASVGEKGSISISGIVSLIAGEEVDVWASSDGGAKNIVISDITLSLRRIGD